GPRSWPPRRATASTCWPSPSPSSSAAPSSEAGDVPSPRPRGEAAPKRRMRGSLALPSPRPRGEGAPKGRMRGSLFLPPLVGLHTLPRLPHPNHAEPLPARRLHQPPALHERDLLRAQFLQPVGLAVDVVGLDVPAHARGIGDLLPLGVDPARDLSQVLVFAGLVAGVGTLDAGAQRLAPERGRRVEVVDVAVDDDPGEAAAVG